MLKRVARSRSGGEFAFFIEQGIKIKMRDHLLVLGDDRRGHPLHFGGAHFRHRLDFVFRYGDHVGNIVDQQADKLTADAGDDDRGPLGRINGFEAEPQRHVDHRNDRSAQVDDTQNMLRRMRNLQCELLQLL